MQNNTPDNELSKKIKLAAELLRCGDLVAFPTETVYGLGGNALSDAAVAAIYSAKHRPTFNPLIVHVSSISEAKKYVHWNSNAQILAEHFWPGSLTLVLPRKNDCKLSLLVSAGLDCVAVRIPNHPIAMSLLEECGLPIAAPSANISGHVSPTLAADVYAEFGDSIKMILDGGACSIGIESTIIDLSGSTASILRHGKITAEELEKYIKISSHIALQELQLLSCNRHNSDVIKAPGMLKSHYAPNAKVRLNVTDVKYGEALLAFGSPISGAENTENLSRQGNLEEAAANLFKMLRSLDAKKPSVIAVMPIPETGIGIAINDRLRRAAAPKY